MPENVTNELLYEVLKSLQADMAGMRGEIREVKATLTGVREQLHTMEGNALRQERMMAILEMRIERIETRLSLNDLSH